MLPPFSQGAHTKWPCLIFLYIEKQLEAPSDTVRRKDCTHGTAELWRYLLGKQTPRLLLCVLRHRGNDGPPLPGDLGLLHATQAQEIHTSVQKSHESKLATRKFNSRLRLSALPDWCYRYYWFYCRSIEVSSRVMRKMRWAGASHSGIGWRYSPRRHPLGRGAGLGGGRCGSGPFSGTPQPHSQAVRWPFAAPDSRKTWEDLNYWWILINLFFIVLFKPEDILNSCFGDFVFPALPWRNTPSFIQSAKHKREKKNNRKCNKSVIKWKAVIWLGCMFSKIENKLADLHNFLFSVSQRSEWYMGEKKKEKT